MDLNLVKSYFNDNLKKGYTIELISSNLKNSGYTDDIIKQAVSLLDQSAKNLSAENSKKFDYSKLPKNVQKKITPNQQQNAPQQLGVQGNQPPAMQTAQPPPLEKHPGLDKESLIKYGGIIGGILSVIIIGIIILSLSSNDEFSSGGPMDRYADAIGLDDDIDSRDSSAERIDEDGFDEDIIENETISTNQTHINDSLEQPNIPEETTSEEVPDQSMTEKTCETHFECFDGDTRTLNQCVDGICRTVRDDGRPCVSNDEFCPPRCYGYEFNDSDCLDDQGRMLCTTDEQCNNSNNMTEDYCHMGRYCVHMDVALPNNPPVITSTPVLEAIEYREYRYQVEATDEDGDNLTFSLSGDYPNNMTINSTTGLILWYPGSDDFSSGEFRVIVSDGRDSDEQHLHIMVYMDESEDHIRSEVGDEKDAYLTLAIFNREYWMCKYLNRYWENAEDDIYTCISTIASAEGDESICNYLIDDELINDCKQNI